jgi:hypothetical protein
LKVAFDENFPITMVRVFQTLAKENQFRKLGLIIECAQDYSPKPSDADFQKGNDVPWIKRFASAGGRVIISGNSRMMSVPHERKALLDEGMVVLFFENSWNNWKFFAKSALLLFWWPAIARQLKTAKPKSFWRIPSIWIEKEKLRKIPTDDPRAARIERRIIAKVARKAAAKKEQVKRDSKRPLQADFHDLMARETHNAKQVESQGAKEATDASQGDG